MRVVQQLSNETRYCWEQVLRVNPLFRISQVFAPAAMASRLLPLYALCAAIEETCSAYGDEAVARRKLDWWREECGRFQVCGSDHPILCALKRSGAAEVWPSGHFEALVDSAESRIDAGAPADFTDLRRICEAAGGPQLNLEATLSSNAAEAKQQIADRAASTGLAQVLRESQRNAQSGAWNWLPLALLARHGLTRAEVAAAPDAAAARPLFDEWLSEVVTWLPAGKAAAKPNGDSAADCRHMHVFGALQARALRQLGRVSPSRYGQTLTRVGPAELYQAWRAARRFNRR